MSRNGGYQILNLEALNFEVESPGDTPVTLQGKTGVYSTLRGTKKPVLLSGLTINGSRRRDFYPITMDSSTAISLSWTDAGTLYRVEVKSNDDIVLTIIE